jgi:peptidyl-dipeptidase A
MGRALPRLHAEGSSAGRAILDYFAPLQAWLQEQNKGQPIGW